MTVSANAVCSLKVLYLWWFGGGGGGGAHFVLERSQFVLVMRALYLKLLLTV